MRVGIANAFEEGGATAVRVGKVDGLSAGVETCQPRRTQM